MQSIYLFKNAKEKRQIYIFHSLFEFIRRYIYKTELYLSFETRVKVLIYFTGEGPKECTSCPPHSMLEDGLCKECLGAQYYDSLTRLCKNCHPDCRRCTGSGKFSCAACSPPLHLDKLNNQCVPCCTGNEKGGQAEECCLCDPETGQIDRSKPSRDLYFIFFCLTTKKKKQSITLRNEMNC